MKHKEAIIYDLEYTTWLKALERAWSGKNEYREIIRIGAISIDLESLQEVEAFDILVKPSANPVLSDYCIKLTDITNKQVQAEGIELHEALRKFIDFVGGKRIFSYGTDIMEILENLRLNNIAFIAKTLQNHRPIIIKDYNQTDSCFDSNVVKVILYGSGRRNTIGRISEGVHVEINLNGNCVPLTATDIMHWFHATAPETQGKYSGEIARTIGVTELKGSIHNPLFDARSIHMGLRELVLSRHIKNPLK
ncbi:MAG: exonuclease domain-containing protein [Candidatus Scalindua sp.]|jgi:hypothetical protein|nr:exonuclease domain-containing protein [Candidatus Scalindua sp.]